MNILINDNEVISEDVIKKMTTAASYILKSENIDEGRAEISVSVVTGEEIKSLNSDYRSKNEITDVLSFPQYDDIGTISDENPIMLGDVVVCDKKILEQAEENGHSFDREFLYLFVHSLLHLLGYDHMDEGAKSEMRTIEKEVMEKLA